MRPVLISLSIIAAGVASAPLIAQDGASSAAPLVQPAVNAELTNRADVSLAVRQVTKDLSPFKRVPAIRIGLMVEADGQATECLAVRAEQDSLAYGQELCPAILEKAEFAPAIDADGNAIRSVFFVKFEEYRPGSAAANRTRL